VADAPKPKVATILRCPATGQFTVYIVKNSRDLAPGEAIGTDRLDELIADEEWTVTIRAGKEPK
jgi:hypothetical protein